MGRYLPHSDSIHWLGACEWVFPHPEACWKLIFQYVSSVNSMGVFESCKQRAVLHHQQNARAGPQRSCSAAVPDCRETDWTMRQFRVAPPVTQNSWEVWTCCIRICRRAKSELSSTVLWKGDQSFAKLLSVRSFLAVASSSPLLGPRW